MRTLHYAIVFVKDMKKSIAFYQDIFGLALKFESPEWSEFVTGQATVALHKAQADSTGQEQGQAGRCQLGFHVADIDAFHKEAIAKGVVCVMPPKQEHFGTLAVYADPDGLCITMLQPAPGQG
jgi:lactoylglutathione lyase